MPSRPEWIVTATELKTELKAQVGGVKLVDVREPEEYAQSRIEGCTLIPVGEISARASELDPADNIVLYCAHGVRSLHALLALRQKGFTKLRSLEGGICAWQELG
jgi:rhodanese-related sulfurtransferase